MEPLLLVRGLIADGVLRFSLTQKRWRVNYGLDKSQIPSIELAVPYKAKDSPSLCLEFSYLVVVILLTLLSHYYGGLEDNELLTLLFTSLDLISVLSNTMSGYELQLRTCQLLFDK